MRPSAELLRALRHTAKLELACDSTTWALPPDAIDLEGALPHLTIEQNPQLQRLRGLSGVTSVDEVSISSNATLPDCEVSWLGARIGQELPLGVNGPTGPCP